MFLIMLFGITGNASIIIIILRNKLLRLQPTNLFLLNMAVSDFINLCICPILYIFKRDILFVNYYLPKWCCIATPFLTGTSKIEYFGVLNYIYIHYLFCGHSWPYYLIACKGYAFGFFVVNETIDIWGFYHPVR